MHVTPRPHRAHVVILIVTTLMPWSVHCLAPLARLVGLGCGRCRCRACRGCAALVCCCSWPWWLEWCCFQLLLTVLLLPGSTSGWSNLHQSASLAQLDRSRQSAQLFQRSHAGHSHGQHRDDEALRQAVADLQQHVILHNSRKDSSHDAQRERHAFENDGVEGASEGMASNKLVQKAREEQHAPMELVDADA